MPILEVDEDVYQYILRNAVRIGESGSSILRRLLDLPDPRGSRQAARSNGNANPSADALTKFLASSSFIGRRNVTDRFLLLLSFLHDQKSQDFKEVLGIRGRNRAYFGKTREEVSRSGKTVHPRRIPGTDYWAMTNASTDQKRKILREVLRALGYPEETVRHASSAIS